MGITIHYSGSLKRPNLLPELIEDVKDMATTYNWNYQILDPEFLSEEFSQEEDRANLYGILFTPPESESISLVFLSNGRMVSPESVLLFKKDDPHFKPEWIYSVSTKTEYAGPQLHKLIILYFRYLSKKYFNDFKVLDEAQYWETNDETAMLKAFKRSGLIIEQAAKAFANKTKEDFENDPNFFQKIIEEIQRKLDELDEED